MITERETVITATADEKVFEFYSSEYKWINKIKKLAKSYPNEVIITNMFIQSGKEYSVSANIPKKYLRISPPRKVSEEQRKKMSERLKAVRKKSRDEDLVCDSDTS